MRAKPCAGEFLPNGDFRTVTGRYIQGPLCKRCGAIVTGAKCSLCGEPQPKEKK